MFQPRKPYKKLFKKALKYLKDEKTPGFFFWVFNTRNILNAVKTLHSTDFGFCPGTRTADGQGDALVEWLNKRIEYTAGRIEELESELPEQPLTFGMLKQRGITLRLVTTNLSQKRPESLPLRKGFKVKSEDLDWIMPVNVSNWIRRQGKGEEASLIDVPDNDDMPVILAVRLSLSFPLLFSTVPLYESDWSLARAGEESPRSPVVNRFSDGGLSSNLPIHYFDMTFPERPTFGINLTEYNALRQGNDGSTGGWNRIYMPASAGSGLTYDIDEISSIGSFLMSLINSAKDWQDSMQVRMPGYRERVVHVALNEKEGGINLNMPEEVIQRLIRLGDFTSKRILHGHKYDEKQPAFDFDVHRWRRVLAVSAALDSAIEEFSSTYTSKSRSEDCLLYTSPSPRDRTRSRMPSSA